jgi:pyrroloquinoline quinone biosynthesis protein D
MVDSPAQGGTVLLAPERVFKPDAIAIEILKRCDGVATVAALADNLAAAFNAPRDRVLADVKTLLGSLADKQLLEL